MSKIPFNRILEIQPTNDSENSVKITENKQQLLLQDIRHSSELDNFVVLSSKFSGDKENQIYLHEIIFGKKKKDYKRTVSIVKIKADNRKTIYREYQGRAVSGFEYDMVALSLNSIKLLSHIDDEDQMSPPKLLELSSANWIDRILFYFNHPDKAIMLSVRMGLLSIVLGVVSIIVSIIGLL